MLHFTPEIEYNCFCLCRGGGIGRPACRQAGAQVLKIKFKMYYIYILLSNKTSQFYKGITKDIDARLQQHFFGLVKFTKDKLPLKLIHVELCKDRKETRKMEKFFKSGYGREIIKEIAEDLR